MTPPQARTVTITPDIAVGGGQQLLLLAGPCQIESEQHSLQVAAELQRICAGYPVQLIFKSSFDKANRTSAETARGVGLQAGLEILKKVKQQLNVPVITDIHLPEQAAPAAEAVDMLQIPAFLCRQTDLLAAAASTGKPVHLKKGQFLHAEDMLHAARKVALHGNEKIVLCERGSCYGYRDLVVDMRNLLIMRETGYPVVFDATHSVQSMGGAGGASGGARQYIKPLLRSAVAAGVDGVFLECHDNPDSAPSDGASMLPLAEMPEVLEMICAIDAAARPYCR